MATADLGRFRNNEAGNFCFGLFAKSTLITIHASRRAKRHAPIVVCEHKFLAALIASHKTAPRQLKRNAEVLSVVPRALTQISR
jgi:hypothetical protein